MKTPCQTPRAWRIILVVDDELPKPRVVRIALEQQGYKVLEVKKEEAFRLLSEQPDSIQLLVTSIPEELVPLCPKLPVIYISARPREGFVRSARETPLRVLRKPFTRDALIAKVREVLDRKEDRHAVGSV